MGPIWDSFVQPMVPIIGYLKKRQGIEKILNFSQKKIFFFFLGIIENEIR